MGMSADRDFVGTLTARRLTGVGEAILGRWAAQGLVGTQKFPGVPTRWNRADLLALKERCTTQAQAGARDRELITAT
jgi:hypothetical protein